MQIDEQALQILSLRKELLVVGGAADAPDQLPGYRNLYLQRHDHSPPVKRMEGASIAASRPSPLRSNIAAGPIAASANR
jgi:hypothetical protein